MSLRERLQAALLLFAHYRVVLRKRVRASVSVWTQQVQPFTCPCGAESFVIGDRFDVSPQLKDQKCGACEEVALDAWEAEYEARMALAYSEEVA